jgi:hypothetical protein
MERPEFPIFLNEANSAGQQANIVPAPPDLQGAANLVLLTDPAEGTYVQIADTLDLIERYPSITGWLLVLTIIFPGANVSAAAVRAANNG